MSERIKGILLLMVGGVLAVSGAENSNLPIATFWLGLFLYPIGAYVFLKGNRHKGRRRTRPVRRSPAQATAGSPTALVVPRDEIVLSKIGFDTDPLDSDPLELDDSDEPDDSDKPDDPLELDDSDKPDESDELDDADFKISQDLSFPAEDQEHARNELRKLVRLFQIGSIDKRQFDEAKEKLLL